MIAISLQSGSNGNCIYVETDGVKLLFDAGISGIQAQRRLAIHGRNIREVDAVIISHDHHDHVRCAGIYQRKFDLPVYVTRKTLREAQHRCELGQLDDVRHFRAGQSLRFGKTTVETIPTPHDGVDGVAFLIASRKKRLAILTDLGHPFGELREVLNEVDGAFLESNYDPMMLEEGPYPPFLQDRITGPHGHISNYESAELLCRSAGKRLRWVCLSHLSEQNNTPSLALETHRDLLGNRFALHTASRYEPTGPFKV